MNRKTILTICISSIFIIFILILGITYAYLGKSVAGNQKERTVLIDIESTKIEFTDLTKDTEERTIEPGFEDVRLFTVKNIGNVSVNYNIYLDDVVNTFVRNKDLVYTLYKKSGDNTIDVNNLNPNDIVSSGIFPTSKSYIKINELLNEGDIYTYAFKVTYVNSEENQDVNKGSIFESKIQIDGEVKNLFKENSLAYNILNNAFNVSNENINLGYAEFNGSGSSILSVTNDDYGESYYFKGNVKNNYVTFANMCYRIVRIEGDGSIKLILEDKDQVCSSNMDGNWDIGIGNYGYDGLDNNLVASYNNPVINALESQIYSYYNFQNNLGNNITKLKMEDWCLENSTNNSLKCNGLSINEFQEVYFNDEKIINNDNMLVGTLTKDEINYSLNNQSTYLLNEYQKNNNISFWTLTKNNNKSYYLNSKASLDINSVDNKYSFRPSITLDKNTLYSSGDGSIDNSYIVK